MLNGIGIVSLRTSSPGRDGGGYRLGVPTAGFYRELLNSHSAFSGGSNIGNAGGVPSVPMPWQGQPHSIVITVPPLAVVFFKLEGR